MRILQELRERFTTCTLSESVQARVAPDAGHKIRPVGLAQCPYERVAALLADFAIIITAALIKPTSR
jgi:hypothetical protein